MGWGLRWWGGCRRWVEGWLDGGGLRLGREGARGGVAGSRGG